MMAENQVASEVGNNDPNVNVPPAVREAARRAEEAFRQANPDQAPNEPQGDGDTIQLTDETKEAQDQRQQEQRQDQRQEEARQQEEPRQEGDEQSWQHRYNSMKGRYDRAQRDIARMSEQISNMQQVMASLQEAPAQPVTPDTNPASLLSPDEINEYGDEFLSVVGRRARQEVAKEMEELRAEVQRLNGQLGRVGNTVTENARARMLSSLDDQVPKWRELNSDENFLQWLQLPDPYSGAIRHDLLKAAYEQNSAPRVAAFFNGFLTEEAAVAPARRQEPDNATPQGNGKVPLETFAAPGRAKSAAAGAPAEKPIITRAQISQFYTDAAAGKYAGREAEHDRIEKMIFEANREGRIR